MIIESGVIVALGLLFVFFKCSWRVRMKMLSYPLAMDIGIFIALNIIHWGTFSGVMVAATGALITSALLSAGRYLYGHITDGLYYSGVFNVIKRIQGD
ncbi:hypothetical protein [Herminiimonas sp. CN]|uniref:hypothetical protein n=1 Tax=Herminiimonas sp. CN TaxID=1349818 RepID=UPI000473E671|nr:hypothetical protein [Herminiimonas sp. CN]